MSLSQSIIFNRKRKRHLYLIGLYGSLLEFSGSVAFLIENRYSAGVPPILRSMLEVYVDFVNLDNKPEYAQYMEANSHKGWLKVLTIAAKGTNPHLAEFAKSLDMDAEIEKYQEELDRLKDEGYSPLKVYRRFEKAKMTHDYEYVYGHLCRETHTDLQALLSRHTEIQGDDFTVAYYRKIPLKTWLPYINTASGLLAYSSRRIHDFFETDARDRIQELFSELTDLRKAALHKSPGNAFTE